MIRSSLLPMKLHHSLKVILLVIMTAIPLVHRGLRAEHAAFKLQANDVIALTARGSLELTSGSAFAAKRYFERAHERGQSTLTAANLGAALIALDQVDEARELLRATADPAAQRLVDCDYFSFDEVRPRGTWEVGGDDACHFVAVLSGRVGLEERWGLPPLGPGDTVLVPASAGRQPLTATGDATLLRVALPERPRPEARQTGVGAATRPL